MKFSPSISVIRVGKLAPGDLFIFDWMVGTERRSSIAIKIIDPSQNDQCFMLVLGPMFVLSESDEPELIAEQNITVVSYGKNYTVKLPCDPRGWVINSKIDDAVRVGTNGVDVFMRIPRQRGAFFVDMGNGTVCDGEPSGFLAYAESWKIVVPDGDTERAILQCTAT